MAYSPSLTHPTPPVKQEDAQQANHNNQQEARRHLPEFFIKIVHNLQRE